MASRVKQKVSASDSTSDDTPSLPPGLDIALTAVIASLHEVLSFDAAGIDLDSAQIVLPDGIEQIAGPGPAGETARDTGQPVLVQRAPGIDLPDGYSTALSLPAESRIASYGVITLYHREPRPYTRPETELAAGLVRQAVEATWRQAVAHMRQDELAQQIEQRAVEIRAFDDIMPRISFRDPAETLQTVVDIAAELADADFTSIFLRDGDRYIVMAAHGITIEELQAIAPTPRQGLIAQLLRTREPIMVSNYVAEVAPRHHDGDDFTHFGVQCTLAVPLLENGVVSGALYAAKNDPTPFDPGITRLLQRLAVFSQIALRNAHHVAYIEQESGRLRGILDTLHESVMVFDRDGRVIAVNESLEREFQAQKPLTGLHYEEVTSHPERYFGRRLSSRANFGAVLGQVLQTGETLQGITELTDGERSYDARVGPLRTRDEITGVVVTLRDITPAIEVGRARSRAQVLDQLLQLSAVLNSQLSIGALLDRVVEAAVDLTGARSGTIALVEDGKLVIRRWLKLGVWADLDLVLNYGEGVPGLVWKTGRPYISNEPGADPNSSPTARDLMGIERVLSVPMFDRSGHLIGTIQTHNPLDGEGFDDADVEALQLLSHQAAVALENVHLGQLKDEFLSVASHELKTPVTSIKGFTQVLQRRLPEELADSFGRYLDIVDHQANRLTELINSLLDVSRIQRGRFTFDVATIDYGELVRDVVAEMQMVSPHNTITLEAPHQVLVRGNANRLRQVLVNLIDNAIKYGPQDGTIRVTVQPRDGDVATYVCDEGPGLPNDERDRIFSPYYQIAHSAGPSKGLGLGLFITRQIISEHGGDVWLDDTDHTSFCYTIPSA